MKQTTFIFRTRPEDATSKWVENTATQTTCYPNLHHIMFIHYCEKLKQKNSGFFMHEKLNYLGLWKNLRQVPWNANRMWMRTLCLGPGIFSIQYAERCRCVNTGSCTTWVCHNVCLHISDISRDMKLEQRANIKFCMKLGKSGTETNEMIRRAYGNEAMSHARCFKWHAHFTRGRTSLEDDERSGWPSSRSKI